jgi:hypothetical protein
MPHNPTCDTCHRLLSDPRSCEYDPERGPVRYGHEEHPLSVGPTCRDCGARKGTLHHLECIATECPECHGQYHGSTSCEEDRLLRTGSGRHLRIGFVETDQ